VLRIKFLITSFKNYIRMLVKKLL